jgi:enoyl-CoA hydratase
MADGLVLPTYETLLLGYDGAVATVTLNRPKVLNALNVGMFDDLERVFTLLARDPSIRVVVLTGAGEKAFAAGADIAGLAGVDAAGGEALSLRGQAVMRLLETCGKPVIACVNGFALGGGCELALCCTFRIAAENARLGMPEVKLGLIPGYGGTQRLPRLVGQAAALKMLLTGEAVGAAEALRIGLVDEVAADAPGRAGELARAIAVQAPLAVAGCLEAVRGGAELGLAAGLGVEAGVFGRLCGTRDKAEGVAAFLAKRAASWAGE